MNPRNTDPRESQWTKYYERFPYFSSDLVRPFCHPRIMEHEAPVGKAIVLVHGLTDSPYFMTAIARHFYEKLNYDVYMPLLHCHGLREPKGMEGVDVNQWIANVNYAVDAAAARSEHVSIGGLSTGGGLSFYTSAKNPKVNGDLYLFSAALDLFGGWIGEIQERLLRLGIDKLLDKKESLIGDNPFRYANMDMDGARELSKLIKKTDKLSKNYRKTPFAKRVFAAHSESDIRANITGIEDLQKVIKPGNFTFYRIPKSEGVLHACLVLKDPVFASGGSGQSKPLEEANHLFGEMMDAVTEFEKAG